MSIMHNAEKWLVDWFKEHGVQFEGDMEKLKNENFFNSGWIDSLGIIDLISDLEKQFNFAFLSADFQDRRFSSIQGLVEIIKVKISE